MACVAELEWDIGGGVITQSKCIESLRNQMNDKSNDNPNLLVLLLSRYNEPASLPKSKRD